LDCADRHTELTGLALGYCGISSFNDQNTIFRLTGKGHGAGRGHSAHRLQIGGINTGLIKTDLMITGNSILGNSEIQRKEQASFCKVCLAVVFSEADLVTALSDL